MRPALRARRFTQADGARRTEILRVHDDSTLGGYFRTHTRPPAFEGSDGEAYSVAVYVDEEPGPDGRLGGALLFVRWSPKGDQPEGHLESDYLAYGSTPADVE